jgi:hypothetical protein
MIGRLVNRSGDAEPGAKMKMSSRHESCRLYQCESLLGWKAIFAMEKTIHSFSGGSKRRDRTAALAAAPFFAIIIRLSEERLAARAAPPWLAISLRRSADSFAARIFASFTAAEFFARLVI